VPWAGLCAAPIAAGAGGSLAAGLAGSGLPPLDLLLEKRDIAPQGVHATRADEVVEHEDRQDDGIGGGDELGAFFDGHRVSLRSSS
jgi:hypothetical protein